MNPWPSLSFYPWYFVCYETETETEIRIWATWSILKFTTRRSIENKSPVPGVRPDIFWPYLAGNEPTTYPALIAPLSLLSSLFSLLRACSGRISLHTSEQVTNSGLLSTRDFHLSSLSREGSSLVLGWGMFVINFLGWAYDGISVDMITHIGPGSHWESSWPSPLQPPHRQISPGSQF